MDVELRQRLGRRWVMAGVIALVFVVWSLVWCVADVAAFRAIAWAEAWDNLAASAATDTASPPYDPSPDDWEDARWAGEWAVRLSPLNPDYRDALARVYVSRYLSTPNGAAIALPYQLEAADLYRQSIALRPSWPYTYAALAHTLMRMDNFGTEFDSSLHQAMHYGPWEPDVMMAITDMGLDSWLRLRPETRQFVLAVIQRGQAWTMGSDDKLIGLGDDIWAHVAVRHKQLVVCSWMPMADPQIRARCNPATW